MARMARAVMPDVPHHLTQRGVRSMRIFHSESDFREYIRLLAEQAPLHTLDIISYCLMSNHVHLVCVPRREDSLSGAVGEAHRRYTREINARQGVKGHLFQERFFSCPMDTRHFRAAVPYILNNPVKARICERAEEYPWSSAAFNLGLRDSDPLAGPTEYSQELADLPILMRESQTDRESIEALRRCTRTGRPCGSDSFVRALEILSGRKLMPAKRGRHPKRERSTD